MTWLGLDIGGANLKAADGRGWAQSVPFALWREPAGLAGALNALIRSAPSADRLAVTMTGELCDAFRTKVEGVRHILTSVGQAAGGRSGYVYCVDGRLVGLEAAYNAPLLAAASNWHVLAQFACTLVDRGTGLLVDIGSTTTDIIPLVEGHPLVQGRNDTDRLVAGELIYMGVGRTPICALVDALPCRGRDCPVAAELFATTADAYVLLGEIEEDPNATWTADGRPLTLEFARERLARMICADAESFDEADAYKAATAIRTAQVGKLWQGIKRVFGRIPGARHIFLGGSGEFLAKLAVMDKFPNARVIPLSQQINPAASTCGPAHALAVLANGNYLLPEMVRNA